MTTISEFCDKHYACCDGRGWALAQGVTTMAELWKLDIRPEWRIWIATRPDVLDDRTLRLFAVYCARSVQHLMTDQRSIDAVDVAERYAHGHATDDELAAARGAAMDAMDAMDAAMDAAWAAAASVAVAAASVAWAAAADAAMDADFANWLINNTTPIF